MRKVQNQKGFTLAELMLVVTIMTVLAGVSFVAVQKYTRSMKKMEYDGYAKEIFIAAQNHLSLAKSLNYLGMDITKSNVAGEQEGSDNVRYFVVNAGTDVTDKNTLLNLMLPTASVDDTVRLGGKYIVRYDPDEAVVLDVFYWSNSGSYAFTYSNDYSAFLDDTSYDALISYGAQKSVIGWYGGVEATLLTTKAALKAPEIQVRNAEKLTVTVTDQNSGSIPGYSIKLVITGKTSGASREVSLATITGQTNSYVLDDITQHNGSFYAQFCNNSDNNLIPGEDITIYAVASTTEELRAPGYSATVTTNSLFGDGTEFLDGGGNNPKTGLAKIANIRHLENLSKAISKVNSATDKIRFTKAAQTMNLNWETFRSNIDNTHPEAVTIRAADGSYTDGGCFLPVTPEYALDYDGQSHRIKGVKVDGRDHAVKNQPVGLFGSLSAGSTETSSVKDLTLIDFDIQNGTNAGALAGQISGTTVENVLACNTAAFDSKTEATVKGSGSVGGLIGAVTGGNIGNSAAALVVESTGGDAGGLIGSADSNVIIGRCYSGGHTDNGKYYTKSGDTVTYHYNVTGSGKVGGLIGDAAGATIRYSYSTCSVSGGTAGGLAGSASGSITSCYAVGLVGGTTKGLFAGAGTPSCTGCAYLDVASYDAENAAKYEAPAVGASGVTAMDASLSSYNTWAPKSVSAKPYDATLRGKYPYRAWTTVPGTTASIHYGDWPAVETLVVNT